MELKTEELDNKILKIALSGALDASGVGDIEMPFTVISSKRDKVVIDVSGVSSIDAAGAGVIAKAADAVNNKGGKVAIFGASDAVREGLASAGVVIADDQAAAVAAVG